jgi:hypothetical protein
MYSSRLVLWTIFVLLIAAAPMFGGCPSGSNTPEDVEIDSGLSDAASDADVDDGINYSTIPATDAGFMLTGDVDYHRDADVEDDADTEGDPVDCQDLNEDSDPIRVLACCLTETGAVVYGTPWCAFCHIQLRLFHEYAELLVYVDCWDAETGEITAECNELGIVGFPTWIFGDGTMQTGLMHYIQLAEYSGCPWEQ